MKYGILSIPIITVAMLVLMVSIGSLSTYALATTTTTANSTTGSAGVNTQNVTSGGTGDTGNSKVRVIVIFDAKEGKKQDVLNHLVTLADMGKKREGNISFDLYASAENPNELLLDQLWSNKMVYDKHYTSPDTAKIRDTIAPLLIQPPLFKVYTEINQTQS